MAYDRTLGFLDHSEGWRGFNNNVGRFGYKNYFVAGPLLILAALSCVPAFFRSLRRWGHNHLARVGVLVPGGHRAAVPAGAVEARPICCPRC